MALVWIVYMPDAEKRGPDLTRMNKVENLPDEVARMYLNDGSARLPTDDEVAEYEATQKVEAKADEADLGKMLKPELEKMAADLELDVTGAKTKADLMAAIETHRAEKPTGDAAPTVDANGDGLADASPGAGQDHSAHPPTGDEQTGTAE